MVNKKSIADGQINKNPGHIYGRKQTRIKRRKKREKNKGTSHVAPRPTDSTKKTDISEITTNTALKMKSRKIKIKKVKSKKGKKKKRK